MFKNNALKFTVSKQLALLGKSLCVVLRLLFLFFQIKSQICRTPRFLLCSLTCILLFSFTKATFAEGSKDLYPSTATGNRAFLYCNIDAVNNLDSYPFKTQGTHYVYAKAGETIAVASSAVGVSQGGIIVTSPSGIPYSTTTTGLISNRTAELGGPGVGYTPFTITVASTEEGIWRVNFVAPIGSGNLGNTNVQNIAATANWTQSSNSNNVIAAWDVSVRNTTGTAWLTGRVYANVLNMQIADNSISTNGLYTTNYILTEDGRAYRVKTNGFNGLRFTFFSNNNGFTSGGVPTYKSLNTTINLNSSIHDPRTLDDAANKTHKIFYNKPDPNLPVSANGFITAANQTMWLKKTVVLPVIDLLKIFGVEGTEGKISKKGAKITFNSSTSGNFQITIPVASGVDRVLTGVAVPGFNEIFWDAKDGAGNYLPAGTIMPEVRTSLKSAEVHFPYIDMEVNPNGIILELTENNTNYTVNPANTNPSEYSDKIYWDDVNVTNAGNAARYSSNPVTNLTGISSNTNGHKFGTYSSTSTYHFGNNRSIDTWAYIESDIFKKFLNIEILIADVKIESITPDLTQYFSNKKITYTVRVQNDGPSAANGANLAISLPAGLTIISPVTFANQSGGVTVSNAVTGAQSYAALLDMPNQAYIDFVIEATFTGSFNQIFSNTKASILRPFDLTDPDATGNNAAGPVDADEECLNGASSGVGVCNNIKYNTVNGQEVCQGSNITAISYPLSVDGTQFENSTLPTALSSQDAAGNRIISGSLSSSGIQEFFIKTQNTRRTQTNVIIRANALPDATADGPSSVCIDADDNPAISFKGSGGSGVYEFSYTVNNGSVQTVTTPSGSDTATVPVSLDSTGTLTYKLTSIKDLTTSCSQSQNIEVTVIIKPKPSTAHIELIQ